MNKASYPLSASHEVNCSSSLCRGQVGHAISADKQGAGEKKELGPGHLFRRRLGQICKAGAGSSAFLADDS